MTWISRRRLYYSREYRNDSHSLVLLATPLGAGSPVGVYSTGHSGALFHQNWVRQPSYSSQCPPTAALQVAETFEPMKTLPWHSLNSFSHHFFFVRRMLPMSTDLFRAAFNLSALAITHTHTHTPTRPYFIGHSDVIAEIIRGKKKN